MNTNFKVIGSTRLGIKPKSTAPEADALTTRPSELLTCRRCKPALRWAYVMAQKKICPSVVSCILPVMCVIELLINSQVYRLPKVWNKLEYVYIFSVNDMYIELSSFDRDLTGYVSENQLGLVVLRHDLPFKLSTLKMMYKKFSGIVMKLVVNICRV